jgi:hypothetical protein
LIELYAQGVSLIGVIWTCVAGVLFAMLGWRYARLASLHTQDGDVRVDGLIATYTIPLADLREVVVKPRRGLTWATFRFSQRGTVDTVLVHTLLTPRFPYALRKTLDEFQGLDRVVVRYIDCWGRERADKSDAGSALRRDR